ncbi:hypothetical protein ACFE04_000663 [Oxalis oulophora]
MEVTHFVEAYFQWGLMHQGLKHYVSRFTGDLNFVSRNQALEKTVALQTSLSFSKQQVALPYLRHDYPLKELQVVLLSNTEEVLGLQGIGKIQGCFPTLGTRWLFKRKAFLGIKEQAF